MGFRFNLDWAPRSTRFVCFVCFVYFVCLFVYLFFAFFFIFLEMYPFVIFPFIPFPSSDLLSPELAIAHKVTSGFTFGDKEKFEDSFFRLTTPEGTYLFGATGTKERNGWISDIQKASSVAGSEKPIREGSHVYRSKVERYDGKFSHGTRDVSGGFHYFDGSVYVGGWEGNREDGPAMLLHKGEGVSGREEKEEEKEEGEGDGGEEGGGGRAKMASHVFLLCSGEFEAG